jgi:hypothetical protein
MLKFGTASAAASATLAIIVAPITLPGSVALNITSMGASLP